MSDYLCNVKVRFRDERQWHFVSSGGLVSRLRVHALMFEDDVAERCAKDVLERTPDVSASRIVRNGRTVASFGAPTPPKPAPPDYSGYRYLVSARKDRGTFHVKNEDGTWGHVTANVYNACHDEAQRAGLDTNHLRIHGSICSIVTKGLTFVQRSNRDPNWRG